MKQDFEEISLNINHLLGKLLDLYKTEFLTNQDNISTTQKSLLDFLQILPGLDILIEAFSKLTLKSNILLKIQEDFLQEHLKIYSSSQNEVLSNNNYFIYSNKVYFLFKKYWLKLLDSVPDFATNKKRRLVFYFNNLLDANAPQNFLAINPELLYTTIENIGKNLFKSIEHYLRDLVFNDGYFNIRTTDLSAFSVGENLAITPGKVVYQNDLMELIQYSPTTKTVYQAPILLIPPCINKYYILDLSPNNSLVKWLVAQGFIVYMISWVNPDSKLADQEFADYVIDGPLKAIDVITKINLCKGIHLAGYCIGGTMLGCTISYMQQLNDQRILSATHFMSLLDFSNLGNIGALVNDASLNFIENLMNRKGYLDGRLLSMAFSTLRPNDLIWPYIINNYLLDKPLKAFDISYWNSDSTHIPAKMYNFYLRDMCFKNKLCKPNGIQIKGISIDLNKITIPVFSLAGETDHITVWQSVYAGAKLYSGKVQFVLSTSGHVKGLLNPPIDNKYSFKTNIHMPKNPNVWLKDAKEHPGSWWPYWVNWLTNIDSEKINILNSDVHKRTNILQDAPGSYVLKKLGQFEILSN